MQKRCAILKVKFHPGLHILNGCQVGLSVANGDFYAAVADGDYINAGAKLQAYAVGSSGAIYGTSVNSKDADGLSLRIVDCQYGSAHADLSLDIGVDVLDAAV